MKSQILTQLLTTHSHDCWRRQVWLPFEKKIYILVLRIGFRVMCSNKQSQRLVLVIGIYLIFLVYVSRGSEVLCMGMNRRYSSNFPSFVLRVLSMPSINTSHFPLRPLLWLRQPSSFLNTPVTGNLSPLYPEPHQLIFSIFNNQYLLWKHTLESYQPHCCVLQFMSSKILHGFSSVMVPFNQANTRLLI